MNGLDETEARLRQGLAALVAPVKAEPGTIAAGAERRAIQLRRRTRWWAVSGVAAATVVVSLVAALVVLLGRDGAPGTGIDLAGRPGASAAGGCDGLVGTTHSVYASVIGSRQVTGPQLRFWLRTRNSGPYSPSQIERYPGSGTYVVCALRRVLPIGPAGSIPHERGISATSAIVILGPAAAITDIMGSRRDINALMDRLP